MTSSPQPLPDSYVVINTQNATFYATLAEGEKFRTDMQRTKGRFANLLDISGARITIHLDEVTNVYDSTPETRQRDAEFGEHWRELRRSEGWSEDT